MSGFTTYQNKYLSQCLVPPGRLFKRWCAYGVFYPAYRGDSGRRRLVRFSTGIELQVVVQRVAKCPPSILYNHDAWLTTAVTLLTTSSNFEAAPGELAYTATWTLGYFGCPAGRRSWTLLIGRSLRKVCYELPKLRLTLVLWFADSQRNRRP